MKSDLDPFIEHEILSAKHPDREQRCHRTKKKFVCSPGVICEDQPPQKIEFRKKKYGGLEFRMRTYDDRKTARTHRCDLGHFHPIIVREKTWSAWIDMEPEEADMLRRFLNDEPEPTEDE